MQYVFVSDNLLYTTLLNVQDEVCYETTTLTPAGLLVPVTTIYQNKPTPFLSHRRRGLEGRPSTTRKKLAEVHWKGVMTKTTIYSADFPNISGMDASSILKRRNPFSISRRSHFFVGNDGVLYRWKVIGTIGCMLTRDGKEVARCMKKFVTEGMFGGHTKFVLELIDGSETLEMGMLLFTFLLVDHKRHQKQYGHTRTAPENSERGEGADGE